VGVGECVGVGAGGYGWVSALGWVRVGMGGWVVGGMAAAWASTFSWFVCRPLNFVMSPPTLQYYLCTTSSVCNLFMLCFP